MTHLHGGFVAADSDGNPAITPNGFGPGETQTRPTTPISCRRCRPRCSGSTTTAWARPGSTCLPGLAAAYILRDEHDTGAEPNPIGIPGGAYEIPLVIQDRQFNPDGTFLYPTSDIPGRPGSASTSAT